ncbi:hypothetical protein EHO61_00825 [Leptospira fluminis]|uniref:Lipoprotein n=1 Tax=Leptospira fluminis TaxID=2484979 RepID=A0A4R9GVI5_9LEPT|nr:hypothetical protein [Leptospira fluminis]TGK22357.1 hypothetical protein EHO61_00825 [Leptospira fluminis]
MRGYLRILSFTVFGILLSACVFGISCNNGSANCHREVQKDADITKDLEIACLLNPSDKNLCNFAVLQSAIPYQCYAGQ